VCLSPAQAPVQAPAPVLVGGGPAPTAAPAVEPPTWSAAANAGAGYGWTAAAAAPAAPHSAPPPPAPVSALPDGDASAFGTGLAMVGLGVVTTIAMYVWGHGRHLDNDRLIVDGLYATVALYVVVAAFVIQKAQRVSFRPLWVDGDPLEVTFRGAATGGGLAIALLILARLATGHLQGDAGITAILSEQTLPRTLTVIAISCVAAPWVEELLFRGLLAESWRGRGIKQAAWFSGVMFALWHPQALFPLLNSLLGHTAGSAVPFFYYVSMGAVFARLYLKHGLKCSIAAHTAFNGVLVITTLTVLSGPMHTVEHDGVRALVPASWEVVDQPGPANGVVIQDMVLKGPSGAGMVVMHEVAPGVTDTAEALQALETGVNLSGARSALGAMHEADYPMGHAVHQQMTIEGHATDFVVVVRAPNVYQMVLVSGGSGRAEHEFEGILQHMILPA
jgi:membrane protease YdiL (CAAX protease family)